MLLTWVLHHVLQKVRREAYERIHTRPWAFVAWANKCYNLRLSKASGQDVREWPSEKRFVYFPIRLMLEKEVKREKKDVPIPRVPYDKNLLV